LRPSRWHHPWETIKKSSLAPLLPQGVHRKFHPTSLPNSLHQYYPNLKNESNKSTFNTPAPSSQ
jgi:hypothetical protein